MPFTVYVDDNYCYMDEERSWKLGEFATYQGAVAAAKKLVDNYLLENYKPGMTAEVLYRGYTGFGDDPFILGEGPGKGPKEFSAWDYAKLRCKQICNPGPKRNNMP